MLIRSQVHYDLSQTLLGSFYCQHAINSGENDDATTETLDFLITRTCVTRKQEQPSQESIHKLDMFQGDRETWLLAF